MRKLDPGWCEETKEKRRCFRRDGAKDLASWRSGASKGGKARWSLKHLPPIDPDDPWSTALYSEGD